MVLIEINWSRLLIPLDLGDLIPSNRPCYFIQNVVNRMDFSKVNAIIVIMHVSPLIHINQC